ncbi:MAG: hypothetical protein J6C01_03575 [Lachnospiraceae bacterium]|nr:hypothetical protein [Lachnospiraceae bacterium]
MNKKLSCFLCWLPLVLMILVCGPLMFISIGMDAGVIPEEVAVPILILLLLGSILFVVAVWGVMIWLIVKTVKNPTMDTGMKVAWGFGLYMLNVFAFPVYWFMHIKNE